MNTSINDLKNCLSTLAGFYSERNHEFYRGVMFALEQLEVYQQKGLTVWLLQTTDDFGLTTTPYYDKQAAVDAFNLELEKANQLEETKPDRFEVCEPYAHCFYIARLKDGSKRLKVELSEEKLK